DANGMTRGEKAMVPCNPNRRTERVGHDLSKHPEAYREEFLLVALRRTIYLSEQQEAGNGPRPARREDQRPSRGSGIRLRPTAKDIRLHAWLSERLAVLHHERHSLWRKLRRFLFGN